MWPFKKKDLPEEKPAPSKPVPETVEAIETLDIPYVVYKTYMKNGDQYLRRVQGSWDVRKCDDWELYATHPDHILWHYSYTTASPWIKVSESPDTRVQESDIDAVEVSSSGTVKTAYKTRRKGKVLVGIDCVGEVIDGANDY